MTVMAETTDPAAPTSEGAGSVEARPAAILRGSARGLEVVVDARASTDAIIERLTERLTEAPGFFRGSDVRIRVEDGPLAGGCLAKLDEIAGRFELRIVEVGAPPRPAARLVTGDGVPQAQFAIGTAPNAAQRADLSAPVQAIEVAAPVEAAPVIAAPVAVAPVAAPIVAVAAPVAVAPVAAPIVAVAAPVIAAPVIAAPVVEPAAPEGARVVVGPVRSGVVLEHDGHVFIFGDVNPGAEVRASGNIVVLGRLRGTAHAGIGRDGGFILAHCLEPQQLRIGRLVARASDKDAAASIPEIAHVTGAAITVEPYQGRLPRNLATSI
jgi:septum formation inhibitor MinC